MMSNNNEGAAVRDPVTELDSGIGPHEGGRFSIALRGYDRVEVDECLARIAGAVSSLQAAGHGSRRPEPPTPSSEQQRNPMVPMALQQDGRAEVPGQLSGEDGFGARLEKIMVLARREAAEIRAGATAEARQLVEAAQDAALQGEQRPRNVSVSCSSSGGRLKPRSPNCGAGSSRRWPAPGIGRLRSSTDCARSRPRRETGLAN